MDSVRAFSATCVVLTIGALLALVGCGEDDCGAVRIDSPGELLGTWRFTVASAGAATYELTEIDYSFGVDSNTAILGVNEDGGPIEVTWTAETQQWVLVDFVLSYRRDIFVFAVCDTKAIGDYYQMLATPSGILQYGPIPFVGDKITSVP